MCNSSQMRSHSRNTEIMLPFAILRTGSWMIKLILFFFLFGFDKPREDCLMYQPNRNLGGASINVKQALFSLKCSFNLKTGIARLLPPTHEAEVAFQANIHAVNSQRAEKGNFSKCNLHHWVIVLWRGFFLSQFDPVHPVAVWTLAVETHNS